MKPNRWLGVLVVLLGAVVGYLLAYGIYVLIVPKPTWGHALGAAMVALVGAGPAGALVGAVAGLFVARHLSRRMRRE